jgi:hypothetical protein
MIRLKNSLSIVAITLVAASSASAWDLKLDQEGKHTVGFHGFLSQGFLATSDYNYLGDTEDGSFQFTEVGVNASYSPFKRTRIAVQGFAFDVGDVGNFEPLLDYASIEYTFNDYIGLRGGRVRKPSGIYNHIQDLDLARTSVLLPQGIYDARWRDFSTSIDGGMVFGNIPMNKAGSLSYEVFAGMINLSDEGGIATLLKNSFGAGGRLDGLDSFLTIGAQLWWNTPVQGLRVGANVSQAYEFAYDYTIFHPLAGAIPARSEADAFVSQFSVEYLWKSWTFQAEYYFLGLDTQDTLRGASTGEQDSWYISAAYRVNKWLEVGSYYTEHYANQSERGGSPDNYQKDVALSFRFDIKDWWLAKVEGHYIRGTSLLRDNLANPVRDNDGWFMLALKTTFSF